MKNLYLLIAMFCASLMLAQNENNHWRAGYYLDIDFTTNPAIANASPAQYSQNFQIGSLDSSNAISNQNGELLFFFNSKRIFNKNNVSIYDNSIESDYSFNGPLILPHPGDSEKYYVIYGLNCAISGGNSVWNYGANYYFHIVDFNNNPLGEVANFIVPEYSQLSHCQNINRGSYNGNNTYTSQTGFLSNGYNEDGNVNLRNIYGYKPITFSENNLNDGYWVIVQHENTMLSYKLDDTGLDFGDPVVSTFAASTIYTYNGNTTGALSSMIRIVPDYENPAQSKLYGLEDNGNFYSLDFDTATGQFSNFQQISVENLGGTKVNFEFSNDYKKVYFAVRTSGEIIVKDISNLSLPARLLYEYDSPSTPSDKFSVIQKDKYGNLLVGSSYRYYWSNGTTKMNYLHKINNPDSYLNSSVNINFIDLDGGSLNTLPQLIEPLYHDCLPNYNLSGTEGHSSFTYAASNFINISNYEVASGEDITVKAGNFIDIMPGTDIKSGSNFLAYIAPCGITPVKKANPIDQENNVFDDSSENTKLYPNPNNGTFEISLASTVQGEVSIQVVDITGKIVYANSFDTAVLKVDIPNLTAGIYLVKLSGSNYNETIKFIKQ